MTFLQKHPVIVCLVLLCILLLVWSVWQTRSPQINTYTIRSAKLPAAFDGLKVLQVSDLHNALFGKGNEKLLALLRKTHPDLIFLTGDLIDSKRTDVSISIDFVREAIKIAPVYYTPGNHESRIPAEYAALKDALQKLGAVILENESVSIEKSGEHVVITGLLDPGFGIPWQDTATVNYQIVLSHRPELLEAYAARDLDLVFSGHAHGGQFRLPLIGGLFAPQQGLFPQYTEGVHTKGETTLVISRGLGNVPLIPRFNNRPELVFVTLESI